MTFVFDKVLTRLRDFDSSEMVDEMDEELLREGVRDGRVLAMVGRAEYGCVMKFIRTRETWDRTVRNIAEYDLDAEFVWIDEDNVDEFREWAKEVGGIRV